MLCEYSSQPTPLCMRAFGYIKCLLVHHLYAAFPNGTNSPNYCSNCDLTCGSLITRGYCSNSTKTCFSSNLPCWQYLWLTKQRRLFWTHQAELTAWKNYSAARTSPFRAQCSTSGGPTTRQSALQRLLKMESWKSVTTKTVSNSGESESPSSSIVSVFM